MDDKIEVTLNISRGMELAGFPDIPAQSQILGTIKTQNKEGALLYMYDHRLIVKYNSGRDNGIYKIIFR